jgi:hypothetical protein
MAEAEEVFYNSSNGDRWLLITNANTGFLTVRHEANPSSGGHMSETKIAEFLAHNGVTPQGKALKKLLEDRGQEGMEDE